MTINGNFTWGDFDGAIDRADQKLSEMRWSPDGILAVARGGVYFGAALAHRLKIKNFHTIGLERGEQLDGVGTREVKLVTPFVTIHNSSRLLIVDDINCEGWTFKWLFENLHVLSSCEDVRYFALVDRDTSQYKELDWSYWKLQDTTWVNFPWERELPAHDDEIPF